MINKEDYEVVKALAMVRDYCNKKECCDCVFHDEQKRTCVTIANKECLVPGAIKMNLSKIKIDELELKRIKENRPQARYVAKDLNGLVFTYHSMPHKEDEGWTMERNYCFEGLDMDEYPILDLLLSWDDEEPYVLNESMEE